MVKNFSFYFFTFLLLNSCSKKAFLFTSFREPANEGLRMLYSYDGYKWTDFDTIFLKPNVGNQKVMRDPSMVQDNKGIFHLVWTSSWRGDLGFGYASSKNLFQWTEQKLIPVMQQEPTSVNVWAPELFYDNTKNEMQIVWSSCIPGKYERGIEADSNNHRMYYTSTKDFETLNSTKMFYNPNYSVIDGTVVKISADNYILVFKDNTRPERNLKVAFSNTPQGPWINASAQLTAKFTEGPTVAKVKKGYLIYYDAYDAKKYSALFTKDFKTFSNADNEINVPQNHKHGTIVEVRRKAIVKILKQLKGNK